MSETVITRKKVTWDDLEISTTEGERVLVALYDGATYKSDCESRIASFTVRRLMIGGLRNNEFTYALEHITRRSAEAAVCRCISIEASSDNEQWTLILDQV